MDATGKTEIVYSVRATERELHLFERIVELGIRVTEIVEEVVDSTKTEAGLEGGKSLISTFNRMFDQTAFHHEASTRQIEASTRLNETYIDLLRKQVDNQEKLMKMVEDLKKAQSGQSSAIQSLDKRLKNMEQGGATKVPFKDSKNRPHQNSSMKTGNTPSVVPTYNEEQPAKKEGTVVIATAPATNAVSQSNDDLHEQVQKRSAANG